MCQKRNTHTDTHSHAHTQVRRPAPALLYDTPTLASSLQSAEHNLRDEVMQNSVKWRLFIPLTHEVKLCSPTKLGFEPENCVYIFCLKENTLWDPDMTRAGLWKNKYKSGSSLLPKWLASCGSVQFLEIENWLLCQCSKGYMLKLMSMDRLVLRTSGR